MSTLAETQVTLTRVDDGDDGYSPTAIVTKSGNTATIEITDKDGTTTAQVLDGTNGVSIASVKTQYYLSTSSSSATGGSWSDSPQTFVSGKYYWTRDYITYSDGTHGNSTAVYNQGLTLANEYALSAQEAATEASAQATQASEYAARALGNLSTVQSVAETLNWITAHGTMTLTSDTALDPSHVYFVRDNNGDYEVGNYHYSVVTEPDVADIATYYELSINESLNNYVGTHLAVTSEGLWLLPEAGGNKVLIATGNGETYTAAGTYIIGSNDELLAQFTTGGVEIGQSGSTSLSLTPNGFSGTGSDGARYFEYNATGANITNYTYFHLKHAGFSGTATTTEKTYSLGFDDISGFASSGTVCDVLNEKYTFAIESGYHYSSSGSTATNCRILTQGGKPVIAVTDHSITIGTAATYTATASLTIAPDGGGSSRKLNVEIKFTYISGSNRVEVRVKYSISSGTLSLNGGFFDNGNLRYSTTIDAPCMTFGTRADDDTPGGLSATLGNMLYGGGDYQTVIGKYNVNDTSKSFIIGWGTDTTRHNILTVDKIGNVDIPSSATYKVNGTALVDKYTRSSAGDLDWTSTADGDAKLIAKSALAFWNGAYSGNSSNLSKCSTGNIIGSNGGTMTGQLLTSFKSSVAVGSYGTAQSTLPNFVEEVRFSSGCVGSVNITTAYTKNNVTVNTGWYNFLYSPHRSGGVNGAASGDNCNYGTLILAGMTTDTCGTFFIRISSGAIQSLRRVAAGSYRTTFTPTSGNSYANYGGCYYEYSGHILHVHIGVNGLTANTLTTIYTLPSDVRPTTMVFGHGTGGTSINIGYAEIGTDGVIKVRAQSTACGVDITYMI